MLSIFPLITNSPILFSKPSELSPGPLTPIGITTIFMCRILTFDPAKHAIPKWCTGRKWHTPMAVMGNRVGGLGWRYGTRQNPMYSHRLMNRKRVTCELRDSYFRLMTIKHAIPKIEWAIQLLYNSVRTGSRSEDVVEKVTTWQKGPSGPPEELEIRWVGENMR